MLGTILLIILIFILIGALPRWPYSSGWDTTQRRGRAVTYHRHYSATGGTDLAPRFQPAGVGQPPKDTPINRGSWVRRPPPFPCVSLGLTAAVTGSVFLLSDESGYITGAEVTIDGGASL